jgi:hypothetical protein
MIETISDSSCQTGRAFDGAGMNITGRGRYDGEAHRVSGGDDKAENEVVERIY